MKSPQDKIAYYSVYDMRTGCRIWTGLKSETGYGVTRWKGGRYKAHRLAWEAAYGKIAPGNVIHHICARRDCVNVAHLRSVSAQANGAEMLERQHYLKTIARLEKQVSELLNRCGNACTCHVANIL